jgi:hypothetical protein
MHRNGPLLLAVGIAALILLVLAPSSPVLPGPIPSTAGDASNSADLDDPGRSGDAGDLTDPGDSGDPGGGDDPRSVPDTAGDPRGSSVGPVETTAARDGAVLPSRQPRSARGSLPSTAADSPGSRTDSSRGGSVSRASPPVPASPSSIASEPAPRPGSRRSPVVTTSEPPSQPSAAARSSSRSSPPSPSVPSLSPGRRAPATTASGSTTDRAVDISSTTPMTTSSPRGVRGDSTVVPSITPTPSATSGADSPARRCPTNTTAD